MIGFGGVFAPLLLLRVPSPYLGVYGEGRMETGAWEREILGKTRTHTLAETRGTSLKGCMTLEEQSEFDWKLIGFLRG